MIKDSTRLAGYRQQFSLQTAWVPNVRLMDNGKTAKSSCWMWENDERETPVKIPLWTLDVWKWGLQTPDAIIETDAIHLKNFYGRLTPVIIPPRTPDAGFSFWKFWWGGTRFPPTWASRWGWENIRRFLVGWESTILPIWWVKTLNKTYFVLCLSWKCTLKGI